MRLAEISSSRAKRRMEGVVGWKDGGAERKAGAIAAWRARGDTPMYLVSGWLGSGEVGTGWAAGSGWISRRSTWGFGAAGGSGGGLADAVEEAGWMVARIAERARGRRRRVSLARDGGGRGTSSWDGEAEGVPSPFTR